MYAKIQITGKIELKTGMHIGGSAAFAAIGAVDAPIVRDVRSNLPMIPGSSFKGKLRALLAKEYNEDYVAAKPDNDAECLLRIFGSAKENAVKKSRVLIADMIMSNGEDLRKQGLQSMTEVKFENSINRATAVANPRQIERAVRGSEFDIDIIYEAEKNEEIVEDMEIIAEGFRLLQYDYLGGSGSRGYGKVCFHELCADVVVGEIEDNIMKQCNELLSRAAQG